MDWKVLIDVMIAPPIHDISCRSLDANTSGLDE
jgi:hypothetical protein